MVISDAYFTFAGRTHHPDLIEPRAGTRGRQQRGRAGDSSSWTAAGKPGRSLIDLRMCIVSRLRCAPVSSGRRGHPEVTRMFPGRSPQAPVAPDGAAPAWMDRLAFVSDINKMRITSERSFK